MSGLRAEGYLDRRRGVGTQCWGWCDRTPCVCPKPIKRSMRKRRRALDRRVIAEQMPVYDPFDPWDGAMVDAWHCYEPCPCPECTVTDEEPAL